jgi:hypothetical protein
VVRIWWGVFSTLPDPFYLNLVHIWYTSGDQTIANPRQCN